MSEGIVIIRPSFMKFCEDGCRAALFNHILYWIAWKAKDQPLEAIQAGEITYYATTEELVEHMAGAWGYQKVRREVNELIVMGIIGKGKNLTWGADRTKHFHFGKEQCQKLLEFCQKYEINLFGIGLPAEVIELIKAVRQFTDQSNANDQLVNCPEHKQFTDQSNAIYQSVGAITKVTTKVTKTKVTERKNDVGQRKANVATEQEASHSSIHPSPPSQNSSSQETKPEEVIFTEDEQKIYDYGRQTLFKATPPPKTAKLKSECAELALHIKTQEQFESLVQVVRKVPYIKGQIHLKNLVNELNGWLQSLEAKPTQVLSQGKAVYEPYVINHEVNERRKAALRAEFANS
jgi:hypothetical protein